MGTARYEIIRQLACGGMAEVLLARRQAEGQPSELVVIKRVLPHLSQAEGFMRMFATESRIASQLRHPNIVAVVEVGEMDALPFIAMERLDGADLLRLLQQCVMRRQQLGAAVAMAIIAGAARGLGYAHRARARDGRPLKIIHRDVSPHNLFVTRDGGVKLLDFGIAKSTAHVGHTSTGQVKGKISYMSPEQIRAKPLDARSDLWSLGVVLWESVAGEKLFTRDNDAATLHAILHDAVPRLNRAEAPGLDDLVASILTRDPARRVGTAEEIAQRLEQLLGQMGHTSLTRLVAARVTTLVPALNPEIDLAKPAAPRTPEVVTFAVGPTHAPAHSPSPTPRRLSIAPGPLSAQQRAPEDEDPTLMEILAPPADPDYDAEETADKGGAHPVMGETTDTHKIPNLPGVPRPFSQATGTGGPPAGSAQASRRSTMMFSGQAPPGDPPTTPHLTPEHAPSPVRASSKPILPRALRDADDSATSEVRRPQTLPMPSGPAIRPMTRAAPAVPPSAPAPKPAATLPPPTPKTPPPAARESAPRPPPLSALATTPGVGEPPPRKPPPKPPANLVAPPSDLSAPSLASLFGDPPPARKAPPPSPPASSGSGLFAEPPPPAPRDLLAPPSLSPDATVRVPVEALAKRNPDTLAAAEIARPLPRNTVPIAAPRRGWVAAATFGGLCVVAAFVVAGAWAVGGLRNTAGGRAATASSTATLRPAAPAPVVEAPAVAAPVAEAPAAPVAAAPVAPAPVVENAPSPEPAPPVAREEPRAPTPARAPALAARTVARAPSPAPAPRAAPRAPAPARPVSRVPSTGLLPTPFDDVAPAPRRAAPVRVAPVRAAPSRPEPAPSRPAQPTNRPPPSVRGGGIFTDI